MKVRIIENTVANKKPVYVNDVIDLPDDEAILLGNYGRAVLYKSEEETPPVKNVPLTVEEAEAAAIKKAQAKAAK
jgi:hypothetical protein